MLSPGYNERRPAVLQRSPVELLYWNAFQVDSLETTNIDGADPIAFGVRAFAVGVDAAHSTELVLDYVLVERVGGDVRLRGEQLQFFARHEPQ